MCYYEKFNSYPELTSKHFNEHWLRLVIKMATGSGKTKVMSLLLLWSYFNKIYEENSEFSSNFLIIAPNIIVLDRLKLDFDNLNINMKKDFQNFISGVNILRLSNNPVELKKEDLKNIILSK